MLLHVGQHQGAAQRCRQCLQCAAHVARPLGTLDLLTRRWRLDNGSIVSDRNVRKATRAARGFVQYQMLGDGEQPARERRLAAVECRQTAIGAQEGLLRQLFRDRRFDGETAQEFEDRTLVAHHEQTESVAATAERLAYQKSVIHA